MSNLDDQLDWDEAINDLCETMLRKFDEGSMSAERVERVFDILTRNSTATPLPAPPASNSGDA